MITASSLSGSTGVEVEESLEDAFRRVTSSLCAAAWGCDVCEIPPNPPPRLPLEPSRCSAFITPSSNNGEMNHHYLNSRRMSSCSEASAGTPAAMENYNRTPKVSKTSYSDHGDHASSTSTSPNRSVLAGLVFQDAYPENTRKHPLNVDVDQQNQQQQPDQLFLDTAASPVKCSRQHALVKQMTIEFESVLERIRSMPSRNGTTHLPKTSESVPPDTEVQDAAMANVSPLEEKVLTFPEDLDSNLPTNHGNTANNSNEPAGTTILKTAADIAKSGNRNIDSINNSAKTLSGSYKSGEATSHNQLKTTQALHQQPTKTDIDERGARESPKPKCLTTPSKPVSNAGLDNAEGNLIVHESDIFHIPNSSFCYLDAKYNHVDLTSPAAASGVTQFQVLDLLGQGTFAQVFHCVDVATGENLAIKVVKNKPAYTRQAAVEIDIFKALLKHARARPAMADQPQGVANEKTHLRSSQEIHPLSSSSCPWVNLECYFFYQQHLCLVFELLGCNLYEVLKKRQFRGLPLTEVKSILRQSLVGMKRLAEVGVVHCDLKPENILLVEPRNSGDVDRQQDHLKPDRPRTQMKIIDFGSATFEGQTTHSYIQSRFYRSPEVLVGLPYDSAIDMWSLGCVAAELYLGLPILPGMHEHDQLGRITEMIGPLPDWMMDRGSKASKYYVKTPLSSTAKARSIPPAVVGLPSSTSSPPPSKSSWRLKTREEYAATLPQNQRAADLQAQNTNRYFKRKKLEDIVMLHGQISIKSNPNLPEVKSLKWFIHFLKGMLDPDPWKRWTSQQAFQHPFLSDNTVETVTSPIPGQFNWTPPWDPSICRRKLLSVEKTRDMKAKKQQQNVRKQVSISETQPTTFSPGKRPTQHIDAISPEFSTSRVISMTDAMTLQGGSLSYAIQEHDSDVGVVSATHVQRVSVDSPPPSLAVVPMMAVHPNPYANGTVHAATFNETLSRSPGISDATYVGVNTMQLSPYNFSVAYNNMANPGNHAFAGGTQPTAVNADGHGLGAGAAAYPSLATAGFDAVSSQYGSLPLYIALASIAPQSFTAGAPYFDRSHQLPIQGELGYALTRPGVVPGNSSATEYMQQQQLSPQHSNSVTFGTNPSTLANASSYGAYAYSPQMPVGFPGSTSLQSATPPNVLSRSGSGIVISGPRMYNNAASSMLTPPSQPAGSRVRRDARRLSVPTHPEDASRLGEERHSLDMENWQFGNNAPQTNGVTSLLAQQLAEHDHITTQTNMLFLPQQQQPQGMHSLQSYSHLAADQIPIPQSYYNQARSAGSSYGVMYQMPNTLNGYPFTVGNPPVGSAGGATTFYNSPLVSGMSIPDAASLGYSNGVAFSPAMMGTVPTFVPTNPAEYLPPAGVIGPGGQYLGATGGNPALASFIWGHPSSANEQEQQHRSEMHRR